MDINQITYLTIIYSLVGLFFQIPVGILADKVSRKKLIVISAIFSLISVLVYSFSSGFWPLALGMVFYALREIFWYSSANGFIIDSIKEKNLELQHEKFEKITSQAETAGLISLSIGGVLGSFIAINSLRLTYQYSVVISIILIFIALLMKENKISSTLKFKNQPKRHLRIDSTIKHFRKSLSIITASSKLQFIIYFYIIIQVAFSFIDEFDQIFLQEINVPLQFFGIWIVLRNVLNSFGSILTSKLKKLNLFNYNYQISILLITILGFVSFSFDNIVFTGINFLLLFFILGFASVLSTSQLHENLKDEFRSSIESFSNLVVLLIDIPTRIIFGFIIGIYGINTAFVFLGICIIVYLIFWLPIYSKAMLKG